MDAELTIYRLAADYDERYPDAEPEVAALKAVRALSNAIRHAACAKSYGVGWRRDPRHQLDV
jgi:hypothetical protein